MRQIVAALVCLIFSTAAVSQSVIEDIVGYDHSWVRGSYWNPEELPNWGVLVDVQEHTMFGAFFGYLDSEPSFIVFVGTVSQFSPVTFEGEVYFVTEPGVSEEQVGTFRWTQQYHRAGPAAELDISSNILNETGLSLRRFGYSEVDEIDMISGASWNIVRRIFSTFADFYGIGDDRTTDEDGIVYVPVVDLGDTERTGEAAYFPPANGDVYAMLVDFDEDTEAFYLFFASNTDMYGRYWLLDAGEEPVGDGNYFRAATDTFHDPYSGGGSAAGGSLEVAKTTAPTSAQASQLKQLEQDQYDSTANGLQPMFTLDTVDTTFRKLRLRRDSSTAASR